MSARAPHGALGAWESHTPTVRAALRGAAAPHVPHVSATDSATGASHPAFAPPRLTSCRVSSVSRAAPRREPRARLPRHHTKQRGERLQARSPTARLLTLTLTLTNPNRTLTLTLTRAL